MALTGIAAYLGKKEAERNECLKKFKEAKAFCLRTAVTIEEAGIERHEKHTLQSLVKAGKLKKTKDYRYYLPCKDKK